MRKVIMTAMAIILWLVPVILLVVMLVPNVTETKTFDLSTIKSEQIILGTSEWIKPDFDCLTSEFVGTSYELVMVGVADDGKIIYLGKTAGDKWYQAEENLDLGFLQEAKEAKIDSKDLVVSYGKDSVVVALVSILSLIFFGLIGFVVLFYRED